MFKSIKYRLVIYCALSVASTAAAVWLLTTGQPLWAFFAVCALVFALRELMRGYEKLNRNFIFLLNALENGDYSFRLSETGITRRERELNGILNAIKEILVRARHEEIENERFLSLIVAAVPVGIVIVDEREFVKVANDAALRLLGMHVFTHTRQLEMIDEAVARAFGELSPGGKCTVRIADEREERLVSLGMSRIEAKKGTLRVITMHNIAGELEEREMESWIKLIRVMTHEIMNSIAPITSLGETMLLGWKEGGEDEKLRRNTVDAFETITSTARGLLSFVESYRRFTGIPKPELRPVRIAATIERVVKLEATVLDNRGIGIVTRIENPTVEIAADEGQIAQVLVNLLRNAAEAIPDSQTDGLIEVRVSKASGGRVSVEVANNGTPIPEDVLPSIFIPFFTTKDAGTGIGLSVSRHIMRLHGGNLQHRDDKHRDDRHRTGAERTIFSMVFPVD